MPYLTPCYTFSHVPATLFGRYMGSIELTTDKDGFAILGLSIAVKSKNKNKNFKRRLWRKNQLQKSNEYSHVKILTEFKRYRQKTKTQLFANGRSIYRDILWILFSTNNFLFDKCR